MAAGGLTAAALFQYLLSGLSTGSIYALIALGFCLVHNATGIVNFAQVDFVTLGGMMMFTFLHLAGLAPLPAFALAVLAVGLVAVALERFILRPAHSRTVINLVFLTIAASILLRGGIKLIWGKNQMALPPLTPDLPLRVFGAYLLPQNLWIGGITLVVVLLLHLFFQRTIVGKAMRAAAYNPRAAALAGINVERMVMLSFFLSGALGGAAGILIVPITTLSYDIGIMVGLKGFAAAILGGYGSSTGAVVGGLLLGVLESLGAGIISSAYKDAIAFVILLLVLIWRPHGLLGKGTVQRV